MQDRFLSRGKRIDNNEWEYGLPSYDEDGEIEEIEVWSEDDINFYSVDPSTVCQCTGIKDKNGKLIFENDIVETQYGKAVVVWDKSEWRIKWNDDLIWRKDLHYWANDNSWRIEVVGNKFDNPELLEVQENREPIKFYFEKVGEADA